MKNIRGAFHHILRAFLCSPFSLLLFVLVAMPAAVSANDGVFYASGNQLIPWRNHTIRVHKEILTISLLNDQEAKVDVYYEFLNPEEATSLTVGFEAIPPEIFGESQYLTNEHPYMHDFTVEVNGVRVPHQSALVANDSCVQSGEGLKVLDAGRYEPDEANSGSCLLLKNTDLLVDITYVYFFYAQFKKGINRVHHTYTYRMSESQTAHYGLNYKLSPALRWANAQIDDFTLRIKVQGQGLHFFLEQASVKPLNAPTIVRDDGGDGKMRSRTVRKNGEQEPVWEFSLRDATIEFQGQNYRPEAELYLYASDFSESGDENQSDFYSPSYEWLTGKQRTGLENLALQHLKEAEQGKTFKNRKLQSFFNARWWYMPRTSKSH